MIAASTGLSKRRLDFVYQSIVWRSRSVSSYAVLAVTSSALCRVTKIGQVIDSRSAL